jgi:hypothetical protein
MFSEVARGFAASGHGTPLALTLLREAVIFCSLDRRERAEKKWPASTREDDD